MDAHWLKINGFNLQIYTWGEASQPPLFLTHGWLDTGASFHFFAEKLAQDFYLIAPDMRGYGQSEHTSSVLGYFFFEYVADLKALIDHFSPKNPIHLLGHSLGGAVASVYAGSYPDRVSSLINVEGFGFQRRDLKTPPERTREWFAGIPAKPFSVYPDEATFVERLQGSYPRLTQARAQFLAKYLSKKVADGVQMAADPKHRLIEPYSFPLENFFSFWQYTTAQSLFVFAEHTEMKKYFAAGTYEEEMADRRKFFPKDCQVFTIPDCGHMVHHEKPEELAEAVQDFLLKANR